jgi:filamentous hemagglutinin family protein
MRNKQKNGRRVRELLSLWTGLLLAYQPFLSAVALASPEGAEVVNGEVNISGTPDYTVIEASDGAIIEYTGFDIAPNETVQFVQPSELASVLNRVNAALPSQIDGTLLANGQVYIVNPAGIVFGENAAVDVVSLIAAAGDISNEDFLAGNDVFTGLDGTVENYGHIQADMAAFLGSHVANHGIVDAPDGLVMMVAGDSVLLGRPGSGYIKIDADAIDLDGLAGVENTGTIDAEGGNVVLAAGDYYSLAIRHTGTTRARSIVVEGGDGGIVEVAGTLDASDREAGGVGGSIDVQGDKVAVHDALLDASGDAGGGSIRVGGDFQGGGDARTASQAYVASDAVLRADAVRDGDGGNVIVWSDQATQFYGELSARGGTEGGDGGFAEISGAERLVYDGGVDMRAPAGERGTVLFDPKNITIADAGTAVDPGVNTAFDQLPDMDVTFSDESVEDALDGANLELQANNDIDVTFAIDTVGNGNTQDGNLTLRAGRSIDIGADVTLMGSFTATASDPGMDVDQANRDTGLGNFTMAPGATIDTTAANSGAGADISINVGPPGQKAGDATGDGFVGGPDFVAFSAQVGMMGPDLSADFTGDGVVGGPDFGVLSASSAAGGAPLLQAGAMDAGSANVSLTGDRVEIVDNVAGDQVTIAPTAAGKEIDLGTEVPATLSLTDAELDFVNANVLHVGSADAGNIGISTDIDPAGAAQLELESGGWIQSANNTLTATDLALQAGVGIDVQTDVDRVEAQTQSGDLVIDNTGTLEIGNVTAALDGVTLGDPSSPSNGGGEISVTASSPLTVNEAVTNADGGNITLEAMGNTTADDLTVNANVTASGGTGAVALNAGDSISLGNGATVSAANSGAVTLTSGTGTATGTIAMADGTSVQSGSGTVTLTAPGSIGVANVTTGGTASITSATGAIEDAGDTASDIVAATADLTAPGGIGATSVLPSTAADAALEVEISGQISADASGSSAAAGTTTVALSAVNDTDLPVELVQGAAGTALLTSTGGAITDAASDPAADVVAGALGANASSGIDLDTAVTNVEAETDTGSIDLANSGALGIGGVDAGLTGLSVGSGAGGITVSAQGMLGVAEAVSADTGTISLSAADGIQVAALVSTGNASASAVQLDADTDAGDLDGTLDITSSGAIDTSSGNGGITARADDVAIAAGGSVDSGTGDVTLEPSTGISIGVGDGATGDFNVSQAEIDAITVNDPGTLTIGDAALGSSIQVNDVAGGARNIALLTGLGITDPDNDASNLTTTGALTLQSGLAIGAGTAQPLNVDVASANVTGTGGNDVAIRDAGSSDTVWNVATGSSGAVNLVQAENALAVGTITTTDDVSLTATGQAGTGGALGSIVDAGSDAATDVSSGGTLTMRAAGDIGAAGDPIETEVATLSATTTVDGDITVTQNAGALELGQVQTAGSDVVIEVTDANLTVGAAGVSTADETANDATSGLIRLATIGSSGGDIIVNGDVATGNSSGTGGSSGSATLEAGGSGAIYGTGVVSTGSAENTGAVVLSANRISQTQSMTDLFSVVTREGVASTGGLTATTDGGTGTAGGVYVQADSGNLALDAVTANGGTGDVSLSSPGAIFDASAANSDVDVAGSEVGLVANAGGIGQTNGPLDVSLAASGALSADTTADGSGIAIDAPSGDLPLGQVNAGAGTVALSAADAMRDATANDQVADVVGGLVSLVAGAGGIGQGANGALDVDASTSLGADTSAEGGNVAIESTGDLRIAVVDAGAGAVALSSGAAISDATADAAPDVIGASLAARAQSGIDLDTQVAALEGETDTGNIDIANSGGLTIGGVDAALTGVSVTDSSDANAGASISVAASSPITVNEAVTNADGGSIELNAMGNTTADDLTVNANVTASGGTGAIDLNAGDSIALGNGATVSAASSGPVTLTAGTGTSSGTITMADGTSVQSGSGPVMLSAPGTIVVANVATSGTATITSDTGAIEDAGDAATDVAAGTASLTAPGGIGTGTNGALEVEIGTRIDADASGSSAVAPDVSVALTAVNGSDLPVGLVDAAGGTALLGSTGGAITDADADAAVDLTAGSAALRAATGIDLDTDVDTVAANSSNGNVVVDDASSLRVDTVDGLTSAAPNGTLDLEAETNLTIAHDLVSGSVLLNVISGDPDAVPGTRLITFEDGASLVQATSGDIRINERSPLADVPEVGTIVKANGDLTFEAANDFVTTTNQKISAGGLVQVLADNDITVGDVAGVDVNIDADADNAGGGQLTFLLRDVGSVRQQDGSLDDDIGVDVVGNTISVDPFLTSGTGNPPFFYTADGITPANVAASGGGGGLIFEDGSSLTPENFIGPDGEVLDYTGLLETNFVTQSPPTPDELFNMTGGMLSSLNQVGAKTKPLWESELVSFIECSIFDEEDLKEMGDQVPEECRDFVAEQAETDPRFDVEPAVKAREGYAKLYGEVEDLRSSLQSAADGYMRTAQRAGRPVTGQGFRAYVATQPSQRKALDYLNQLGELSANVKQLSQSVDTQTGDLEVWFEVLVDDVTPLGLSPDEMMDAIDLSPPATASLAATDVPRSLR